MQHPWNKFHDILIPCKKRHIGSNSSSLASPIHPATSTHSSVFFAHLPILDFCKWSHTVCNLLNLASNCLFTRFTCVVTRVSASFHDRHYRNYIAFYGSTTVCLSIHHLITPLFGGYEQCCYEHLCTYFCVGIYFWFSCLLWIPITSDTWFANISLHSMDCLFTFVAVAGVGGGGVGECSQHGMRDLNSLARDWALTAVSESMES